MCLKLMNVANEPFRLYRLAVIPDWGEGVIFSYTGSFGEINYMSGVSRRKKKLSEVWLSWEYKYIHHHDSPILTNARYRLLEACAIHYGPVLAASH